MQILSVLFLFKWLEKSEKMLFASESKKKSVII